MNGYKTSIPRAIFGLAAITMTAFTLEALVILPAEIDSSDVLGPVSGIVTAASAGVSTIATSSDPDSFGKPASATISCTTVKPEHVQRT
jgi:hypothetical protein